MLVRYFRRPSRIEQLRSSTGGHLLEGFAKELSQGRYQWVAALLPSLVLYEHNTGTAKRAVRQRLQQISLDALEKETGLSRRTILRARRGERVHPRSLQRLRIAAQSLPAQER